MLKMLGIFPDQTQAAITNDLDHAQAVGARAVWLALAMEWGFPSSTTVDSTVGAKWDLVVNGAADRGLPVVLQAHGNPTWNITAGGHSGTLWHGPDNATERGNWVTMLHNAVNRWGSAKVSWVEVWNEPNIVEFWEQGPDAANYARLLQAAYVDLKATWPTMKVVGHAMSRNHLGWLDAVYTQTDTIFGASTAAANRYYFDVLGVHPYCGDSTSGYDPADTSHADQSTAFGTLGPDYLDYRRLRDATVTKEGAAKPLGVGEFGYTTTAASWFSVSEATRASYLSSAVSLARGDGYVDYFCPYSHDGFNVGGGFNIHGTSTETAFASA